MSGYFLLLPCFIEIPVFNANSLDPDQTPRFAASDLGLDGLPMSYLWGARHKWVEELSMELKWTRSNVRTRARCSYTVHVCYNLQVTGHLKSSVRLCGKMNV